MTMTASTFLRSVQVLAVGAALASCGDDTKPPDAAPPVFGSAGPLVEWNALGMKLGMDQGSVQLGTRTMAMVHTSVFDAVNAGVQRYTAYRRNYDVAPGTSLDVAAAAAAHRVLSTVYPEHAAEIDALLAVTTAAVTDAAAADAGLALGRLAAADVLAWRSGDGAAEAAAVTCPEGHAAGEWRMTGAPAMMPGWGDVTPWALSTTLECRNSGPPALDSQEYAEAYAEVVALGGAASTERTPEQTATARFWADHLPGHLQAIARQLATERQLDLVDGARLFALLSVTLADANICSWDNKYHYRFWRPVTAVAEGDDDTNPATVGDAAWTSFLAAPPFPEYPSGHSTMAAAGLTLLARANGGDAFTFTRTAMNPDLEPRTFSSLWAMAEEVGRSRIHGGIHFSFSNRDALVSGSHLADHVYDELLVAR